MLVDQIQTRCIHNGAPGPAGAREPLSLTGPSESLSLNSQVAAKTLIAFRFAIYRRYIAVILPFLERKKDA